MAAVSGAALAIMQGLGGFYGMGCQCLPRRADLQGPPAVTLCGMSCTTLPLAGPTAPLGNLFEAARQAFHEDDERVFMCGDPLCIIISYIIAWY